MNYLLTLLTTFTLTKAIEKIDNFMGLYSH